LKKFIRYSFHVYSSLVYSSLVSFLQQRHHDYIAHNVKRQQGTSNQRVTKSCNSQPHSLPLLLLGYIHLRITLGVRILTVFLYLNDVEEGGGTHFNLLNITVSPKKGRALLWPSVLNDNPHQSDWRMYHEALPVIAGIKYGANLWCKLRSQGERMSHCRSYSNSLILSRHCRSSI
jgi:hypothetical protein